MADEDKNDYRIISTYRLQMLLEKSLMHGIPCKDCKNEMQKVYDEITIKDRRGKKVRSTKVNDVFDYILKEIKNLTYYKTEWDVIGAMRFRDRYDLKYIEEYENLVAVLIERLKNFKGVIRESDRTEIRKGIRDNEVKIVTLKRQIPIGE